MTFGGARFYPFSVLACLCATSSSLISAMFGRLLTDPLEKEFAAGVAHLFGFVLLGISTLGFCSLLICGTEDVGTLTVCGRSVSERAAWTGYLVLFLLPWMAILTAFLRV
jgi:hypothetical protein